MLFDPGTFFEIGTLVGTTDGPPVPGDALVAGSGRIGTAERLGRGRGRHRARRSIGSGRVGQALPAVPARPQERVPLVMMLEGAGHRVTEAAGRSPPR